MDILSKQSVMDRLKNAYCPNDRFPQIIVGWLAIHFLFSGVYCFFQAGRLISLTNTITYILTGILALLFSLFIVRRTINAKKTALADLQKIKNEQFYLTESKLINIEDVSPNDCTQWKLYFDNKIEVVVTDQTYHQIGDMFYFVYLEGKLEPLPFNQYNKAKWRLSEDLQQKVVAN